MDVTPLIKHGQQIIQSYADGIFRVSSNIYESAIIVLPHKTVVWNDVTDFQSLTENNFSSLIEKSDEIDVVLLGAGKAMQFFDPKLKATLSAKGLPIDVMDTGAACRTYNVLMAEGRRVVAVLLPSV